MRKGPQITFDQRDMLVMPVTENEILQTLKDTGDLKALGVDGFGAKFFKASWTVVKQDVIDVILDFSIITTSTIFSTPPLCPSSPKGNEGKTIRDIRPISCCTTV
ncbi:unnamed protein product [Lathyrus sativus]|nr:unnamed protein product [Lathyrus sativus]